MRYDYECSNKNCQLAFEVEQPVSADSYKNCPACHLDTLERVILEAPLGFVNEPRSVASLAEHNTRKMGKYKLEDKRREHATAEKEARIEARKQIEANLPPGAKLAPLYEHKPWYGSCPDSVKKTTDPKRVKKYIMEGQ